MTPAGAFVCGRSSLAPLFAADGALRAVEPPSFRGHALAFTATNIYSYAVMNTDFTLFRLMGSADGFAAMATGKVYFERFVVPALTVFVGAISLRVLRHPNAPGAQRARIELILKPWAAPVVLGFVALLAGGYWVFAHIVRDNTRTIELHWIACAGAGYLLYSFNSILLDVLVIRRSLRAVILHAAGFIALACAVQATSMILFSVPGWAVGWLAYNLAVTLVLWRSNLFMLTRQRHSLHNI